jgi:type II secretory pathway pseudopilin PulG
MFKLITKPARPRKNRGEIGFSIIELLIVMLVLLIAAAIAIPAYARIAAYLRIAGDVRDLNGMIAQAKMRAAQDFTHARVNANLTTNTYQLEVWDKNANGGVGCWKTDGDKVNQCTVAASPAQPLSSGVQFGFAGAGPGGLNPQTTIAQAPTCSSGIGGGTWGSSIANTACIEFSSRGLPVAGYGLPNSGSPTPSDALYVTDSNSVYGVTVIVSGLIQIWATSATSSNWEAR